MKHFILTKHNLNINIKRPDDRREWELYRLKIFKEFCFPSIINQICQNFKWLIFVNYDTDLSDFEEFMSYDNLEIIKIKNAGNYWNMDIPQAKEIYKRVSKGTKLITTRLDNDDCLGINTVDHIQSVAEYCDNETIINFSYGYMLRLKTEEVGAYHSSTSNPFLSLVENVSDYINTAWRLPHGDMKRNFPVKNIELDIPAWCMIIHQQNISNRFKVTPTMYWNDIKHKFGG